MGELKYKIGDEVRISNPAMRLRAAGVVRGIYVTTYDVEILDGPLAGRVITTPEYLLEPIGDLPKSPALSENQRRKPITHIIFPDESGVQAQAPPQN